MKQPLLSHMLGMKTLEVTAQYDVPMRIVMKADDNPLNELVVTGYQTLSRERATGSFNVYNFR